MCLFLFLCAQPDSQPSLQGPPDREHAQAPCLQHPLPLPGQSSAAISLSTHLWSPTLQVSWLESFLAKGEDPSSCDWLVFQGQGSGGGSHARPEP